MNINTKTELKGKKYRCLRILKGASIEDIDAMEENIKAQLKAQGYDFSDWISDETSWKFGSQFIMKPKQKKEVVGVLDCTKSYATFDGVRIEYKNIENLFACCFETSNAKYAIHATL